jgi:hypothetical protein
MELTGELGRHALTGTGHDPGMTDAGAVTLDP